MNKVLALIQSLTGNATTQDATAQNTPALDDNTKKLATTEFLLNAFTGAGKRSKTQNGYQVFPGGLILQWGNTPSVAAGASATVSFTIPFPNGMFQVTGTGGSNGNTTAASGYTVERLAGAPGLAGFTLRNWGGNLLAAGSWFAVGH